MYGKVYKGMGIEIPAEKWANAKCLPSNTCDELNGSKGLLHVLVPLATSE